jgi:chaperone required for assembly of F1-ATPase
VGADLVSAGNGNGETGRRPIPKVMMRPLPKRFYREAAVQQAPGGFAIVLDVRPVKTPGKQPLAVPSRELAEQIAAEWSAQGTSIDPATMPLTRIVNSALDGVAPRLAEVAADVVAYAGSDLVCYRAEAPPELVAEQSIHWDPILAWAQQALGAELTTASGVMPVTQPPSASEAVARAVAGYDALRLAALHTITTLTGSALIALAHAAGKLGAHEAWAAAHVDEDWQIRQWGEDAEAAERRRRRWQEMQAASRILTLAR